MQHTEMSSKIKKAIGAVKDQTSISLAKVSSSNNLEIAILKATSHDAVPIEEKYVLGILHLVSSNKAHAASCARAISKRIRRTRNWVVALKSLMLVLRIFQDGDPYFPREVLHAMKRGAKILNLSSFRDDSNSSPWDFTSFIRTFALYLDERLECFLTGKLQRRYTHESSGLVYQRSKSRGAMRSNELGREMKPAVLLDKMSHWQRLLDRAIATRPTGLAKTNHLVHISLYAIVKESFDLYKDISDGLTIVLDSFFHLQYQNCVTAFQTCVKAVKQFEELSAFYTMCKSLSVGRSSEYPSVQTISEELIESLQEFLKDQSSFPSTANRLLNGPSDSPSSAQSGSPSSARLRPGRQDSYGGQSISSSPTLSMWSDTTSEYGSQSDFGSQSELGSQSTSLEDLISASETGVRPSISIDLEAYPKSQRGDGFGVSEAGSSQSLPVMNSGGADMLSLDDWTEDKEETENGVSNWETVLAETISAPSSSAFSQPLSDNFTNTFDAFTDEPPAAESSPSTAQTPLSDNYTNIFDAFTEPPPAAAEIPPTAVNGLDLVLFEAPMPNNNHYNPFLVDPFESPGMSNQESALSVPTFQAIPTFSAQNPNHDPFAAENENDPFASGPEFSGEKSCGGAAIDMDEQKLQQQQQLWLQNQSKIIAKHLS